MIAALFLALLLQLPPVPTFEPIASPTLIPTSTPFDMGATPELPTDHIYNGLATTESNLQSLPADLTNPQGVPIVPAERGGQLFGYVKWIVTGQAPEEVFGPFGLWAIHISILVFLVVFLVIVYLIITVALFIFRQIVRLVKLVIGVFT